MNLRPARGRSRRRTSRAVSRDLTPNPVSGGDSPRRCSAPSTTGYLLRGPLWGALLDLELRAGAELAVSRHHALSPLPRAITWSTSRLM